MVQESQAICVVLRKAGANPIRSSSVLAAIRACVSGTWYQGTSFTVPCIYCGLIRATGSHCIYILRGHTATIRCARVLHNRPIAVTGSRDTTVRVWDIQKGRLLQILQGHSSSVRCLDVCGSKVVSGSYDATCRVRPFPLHLCIPVYMVRQIWNVDTGECLHILAGHNQEIYSVVFDGVRVVSGGMDTTVRVWDATTGSVHPHILIILTETQWSLQAMHRTVTRAHGPRVSITTLSYYWPPRHWRIGRTCHYVRSAQLHRVATYLCPRFFCHLSPV